MIARLDNQAEVTCRPFLGLLTTDSMTEDREEQSAAQESFIISFLTPSVELSNRPARPLPTCGRRGLMAFVPLAMPLHSRLGSLSSSRVLRDRLAAWG